LSTDRRRLIKEVWPDKRLYACTMLFVAGVAGALFEMAKWTFGVKLHLSFDPSANFSMGSATFLLSLGVVVAALLGLKLGRNAWGYAAVAMGVVSLGLVGIVPLLSLIAAGFLVASSIEGEDEAPPLDKTTWPDKALAASLLCFVSALASLAWGGALLGGYLEIQTATLTLALGALALVAGVVNLAAAWSLYRQRSPWLGVAAGALTLASLSFYAVGPILAIVELVLLRLAWSEDEFVPAASA
jgi:hypothetical protein